VSAAKALQVSSKVAFRLGGIEELTKSFELLDKMRSVIGESVYMTRVDAVLASIPDPTSYASEVVAGDPNDKEVQVLAEN
jgi:hypothetical protein